MDTSLKDGPRLRRRVKGGRTPVVDLDVFDALRGDEVLRPLDSFFGLKRVALAEKSPRYPGAPDEAAAKITDLACRLGDPHGERFCHLICPSGRQLRESITALFSRTSKYMVMPTPLHPKEVS